MDIQQAKILLEKINALQKNINTDDGDLARIERDLMLSYIRQLYETYLEADVPAVVARSAPKAYSAPTPPPAPKPVEPIKAPPPPPKPEPIVEVAPPPPTPAPKPVPTPEPVPAPIPVQKAPPVPAPIEVKGSAAVESLFRIKEAKELSEKLSQQEIKDLTKALSINDKLLYSNELFGRDMPGMTQVLQQLNGLSNITEAKAVLIPFAEKFDWTEEERADVAQSFVKLIRRKY